MWNGKLKAVNFSYDDGVLQDRRFIEMLDRYNLKCTFNINSDLLGRKEHLIRMEQRVDHTRIDPEDLKSVYKNHEVAAHTLTHPKLISIEDDKEVLRQVEADRENLEKLVGYKIEGFAYPGGGISYDEHTVRLLRENTDLKYSRTGYSSENFELPTNFLEFCPTVYHLNFDRMFELGKEFIALKPTEPKLFCIFGHSYDFDIHNTWDKMEEFFKLISNREDIFYGTTKEVLGELYK